MLFHAICNDIFCAIPLSEISVQYLVQLLHCNIGTTVCKGKCNLSGVSNLKLINYCQVHSIAYIAQDWEIGIMVNIETSRFADVRVRLSKCLTQPT